jgi:WD40 repeat protein
MSFSSGGSLLLAGRNDSICELFYFTSEKVLMVKTINCASYVENIRFANNSSDFVTAHQNGLIKLWKMDNTQRPAAVYDSQSVHKCFELTFKSLDWSPSDELIVFGHHSSVITIWSAVDTTLAKNIMVRFDSYILKQ